MSRSNFINRFQKQINIGVKSHVAHADAALVNLFINRYIVTNTLIMKCFILIRSAETLNMRRYTCLLITQVSFTFRCLRLLTF